MRPREPSPPLGIRVAVAMLAGVALVQLFPALPSPWLSLPALLPCLWLWSRADARRFAGAFLAGVAWACTCGQAAMAERLPQAMSGSDFRVEGRVLGLPVRDEAGQRFDFKIESSDERALQGLRVRLSWHGQAAPTVEPGSHWRLLLRLKRPRGVLDPGGVDSEKRALVQGIAAIGSVREPRSARLLGNGRGIDAWRAQLSRRIELALPEGQGRFVQALALGDTRAITQRDWEVLRATGLTHQIAISGFHVGMVASFFALLVLGMHRLAPALGRIWPAPQSAALAALLAALAYAALAGFALPTVRTVLMIGAALLARLLRRGASVGESLALALLAVICADPLSVLAPGFWLSFAGVAWLAWCLPAREQPGQVRGFLQAQAVATIALLPLSAWFFGQAALAGPLANLLGIPLISLVVVPLCLLGLLLLPLSAHASAQCWQLAAGIIQWFWKWLEAIAAWPATMLWLPEPGIAALALACLGAFWLLLPRAVPGKALALLLFLPLMWPAQDLPEPGAVDIEVLDVGQGLSVLVRTRGHALLYDAGGGGAQGLDYGETAVVPALRALGVHRLDTLLISHGDVDHAGGMGAVRRAWPMARVLGVEGWAQPGMGLCRDTQAWRWDGVEFRVLHPPPWFPYLRNESSCVLRVQAGGRVLLLPGDIGKQVEVRLLHRHAAILHADLLLMPHHGSRGSSSEDFVAAVHPAIAVASVGADNRFGLPKPEVLARYEQAGSRVLSTAEGGALSFRLSPEGLRLRAARRLQQPRYWRERPAAGAGYARGNAVADR
jgi:competence protein ComEC